MISEFHWNFPFENFKISCPQDAYWQTFGENPSMHTTDIAETSLKHGRTQALSVVSDDMKP